jgi:tetratricopeptide (TPR) repeat protein
MDKSIRMLPSSPWIAYQYAWSLWHKRKFEELANADWFDELKVETDFSIIGNPDYALEATRAQMLRQIAIAVLNPDRGLIETLANQIGSMDPSTHLCDEGKTLALLCANEGYHEFISVLYDRVCQTCTEQRNGEIPRSVDVLLADAYLNAGDYEAVVAYSEKVLADDPQADEVFPAFYWALDEVGRTEEAISIAKRLYDIDPNRPHLAHNLGLMSQHFGRLGEAQYYYERQLANEPHLYSQLGLTFLLLLRQQPNEAERSLQEYFEMRRNPEIFKNFLQQTREYLGPWTEKNHEREEVIKTISKAETLDIDEWISVVNPTIKKYQSVFDELVAFSKANSDSPAFAKDLIEKNQSFGIDSIGPDSTIRPEPYSMAKILSATRHGEDESTYQSKFLMQLEQSGDFSVFQESLSGVVPRFDELPWTARASLLEGERRFISETPMLDHSPVLVSFAKAVEICLLRVVFAPYKSACDTKMNISQQIEIAKADRQSQATSLFTFLERGQHLELGSMAHLLRLCNGRTAEKEYLVGELRNFIRDELNGTTLLDKENVETIGLVAKEFRNPGAHSDVLTKANAEECRRLCVDVLQSLEPCIAEYVQAGSETN